MMSYGGVSRDAPSKLGKPLPHKNTNHLDCAHILAVDDLYNLFSRVSGMLCI